MICGLVCCSVESGHVVINVGKNTVYDILVQVEAT